MTSVGGYRRSSHNGRQPAVRLMTVPHSGTRFTGAVLDALGFPMDDGSRSEHHTDDLGFPMPYVSEGKVVTTIRDPLLAEISRKNRGDSGLPVQEWAKVAPWRTLPNVHFFRLDAPQGREYEIRQLAAFLGVAPVHVEWSPVNTSHDRTGFKARYQRGEIPDDLRGAWEWLRDTPEVVSLFWWLGLDYPWMPAPAWRATASVEERRILGVADDEPDPPTPPSNL